MHSDQSRYLPLSRFARAFASFFSGLTMLMPLDGFAAESSFAQNVSGTAFELPSDPQYYRDLVMRVRTHGRFKIPMPGGTNLEFTYDLRLGKPVNDAPVINDYTSTERDGLVYRVFFDRILLQDDSKLELSSDQVPLSCIFIRGQDNRMAKTSPLLPDILLQFYLVANDFSCTGPINPGWPENGGRKEMWDTFLRFDVRDPTVMLPVDTLLRYRWNEYSAVRVDSGQASSASFEVLTTGDRP